MIIRNLFQEDINRQINGVIKVDQDIKRRNIMDKNAIKKYAVQTALKREKIMQ